MNQDLKDYIFSVFCQGARVIFSALGMAILARSLGPEGLGRWALMIGTGTLFHIIFINWIQQDSFLRFGKEEWVQSHSVSQAWNARFLFIFPGVILSSILILWDPFGLIKNLYGLSSAEKTLAFGLFFSLVFNIEFQTLFHISGKIKKLAFIPVIIAGFSSVLYLGIWTSIHMDNRLIISFSGMLAVTTLTWAIFGGIDLSQFKLKFEKCDILLTKKMVHYGWPLLPAAAMGYLMSWGNHIIIQKYLTTRDVGYYQSAFQIHSLVVMIAVPLTTIIVPRLIAKNIEDSTIMKRFITSTVPTLFLFWILLMIPMIIILPAAFVRIFGSNYNAAIPLLKILLCSTPLCALGQLYTGFYNVQKKLGAILIIAIAGAILNIGIALTFIRNGGIHAVTIAFTISFITSQLLMCFYQHWNLRTSVLKICLLILLLAIFLIGQTLLLSLFWRVVWGISQTLLIIIFSRSFKLANPDTILNLFERRLKNIGNYLVKIFVASNRS